MYATGMPDCPVKSLKLYLSKLNKSKPCFFQRPKAVFGASSDCWYEAAPVGKNTLGTMMQKISKQAGLSKTYTNHSIRATVITSLDQAGFEGRHIQQISGHKSSSSLLHYAQIVSDEQLHSMSRTISLAGQHVNSATAATASSGGSSVAATASEGRIAQVYNHCTFNFM